jgi:hypothetical protein
MASADIDKQAAAIEKRLNIADLQDPAKLDKIIAKFSVGWDASENATPDPVLALFDSTSDSTSQSIDLDLAMTLSSLRHGG